MNIQDASIKHKKNHQRKLYIRPISQYVNGAIYLQYE